MIFPSTCSRGKDPVEADVVESVVARVHDGNLGKRPAAEGSCVDCVGKTLVARLADEHGHEGEPPVEAHVVCHAVETVARAAAAAARATEEESRGVNGSNSVGTASPEGDVRVLGDAVLAEIDDVDLGVHTDEIDGRSNCGSSSGRSRLDGPSKSDDESDEDEEHCTRWWCAVDCSSAGLFPVFRPVFIQKWCPTIAVYRVQRLTVCEGL